MAVEASPPTKREQEGGGEAAASASSRVEVIAGSEFGEESPSKVTKARGARKARVAEDFAGDEDEAPRSTKRPTAKSKGSRQLAALPLGCKCQISHARTRSLQEGGNVGSAGHVCFRHRKCHAAERRLAESI